MNNTVQTVGEVWSCSDIKKVFRQGRDTKTEKRACQYIKFKLHDGTNQGPDVGPYSQTTEQIYNL